MILNVITMILSGITTLITNGFDLMPLSQNVSLTIVFVWSIYISIIFYFVGKLMKAVDNG